MPTRKNGAKPQYAIRVEGLVKRFGTLTALAGVDFEVPEGTIFGLLGPNGAGKTTAVRILATVLRPDGGRAEVNGYDVATQAREVRHQIGLAGQSAAVDGNLTGYENLYLIGQLAQMRTADIKPRALELLERFDLTDAANRTARTYSGGMRRRLDVAAALVSSPPILFLDEPTTGLDIQSRTELWNVIRELVSEGHSVLLTTQYLEEADQLTDRIAVVDHGEVVANDTAAGLKARLGSTVIKLTFSSDRVAKRAHAIVAEVSKDSPEVEGATVRLATKGTKVLIDVLRVLDDKRVRPSGLEVREPSLDDVFLTLTGHHAEEPEVAAVG